MKFLHDKVRFVEYPEKDSKGNPTKPIQFVVDWGKTKEDRFENYPNLKDEIDINELEEIKLKLTRNQIPFLQAFVIGWNVAKVSYMFKVTEDYARKLRKIFELYLK